MLGERELSTALLAGQEKAGACHRLCRIGSSTNGEVSEVWHNALGSSDSDHQTIHNAKRLNLSEDGLASVLAEWLTRLHKHAAYDLNTDGLG